MEWKRKIQKVWLYISLSLTPKDVIIWEILRHSHIAVSWHTYTHIWGNIYTQPHNCVRITECRIPLPPGVTRFLQISFNFCSSGLKAAYFVSIQPWKKNQLLKFEAVGTQKSNVILQKVAFVKVCHYYYRNWTPLCADSFFKELIHLPCRSFYIQNKKFNIPGAKIREIFKIRITQTPSTRHSANIVLTVSGQSVILCVCLVRLFISMQAGNISSFLDVELCPILLATLIYKLIIYLSLKKTAV